MSILLSVLWAASPVIINEVMANPKGTDSGAGFPGDRNEFVELYNLSEETIDLSDWRLTDLDATDYIKAWEDSSLLERYPEVIIGSTLLPPQGFALILDPEYTSIDTVGGYYMPYEIPDSTLILTVGNTTLGDGLRNNDPLLFYDPDSVFISSFGTPDDPGDGFPYKTGDGRAWELVRPNLGDSAINWAISLDPDGATPGRDNSTLTWYDLAILELDLIPGAEGVELLALIENRSYNPAEAWQLWFFDDGDTIGTLLGLSLSPLDSVRMDWSWPTPEPGEHLISCWIDYAKDCDTTNNRAQLPFSNYGASRYLLITPNPFSPDNDGIDDEARIQYYLPEPGGKLIISIYDRKGRLVNEFRDLRPQTAQGEVVWGGLKADGSLAQLGLYIVRFEYRCADRSYNEQKVLVLAKKL